MSSMREPLYCAPIKWWVLLARALEMRCRFGAQGSGTYRKSFQLPNVPLRLLRAIQLPAVSAVALVPRLRRNNRVTTRHTDKNIFLLDHGLESVCFDTIRTAHQVHKRKAPSPDLLTVPTSRLRHHDRRCKRALAVLG